MTRVKPWLLALGLLVPVAMAAGCNKDDDSETGDTAYMSARTSGPDMGWRVRLPRE